MAACKSIADEERPDPGVLAGEARDDKTGILVFFIEPAMRKRSRNKYSANYIMLRPRMHDDKMIYDGKARILSRNMGDQ